MEDKVVLTVGELDGLIITPVKDETGLLSLIFTVDTLPGMRLVISAGASRELMFAMERIITDSSSSARHEVELAELKKRMP